MKKGIVIAAVVLVSLVLAGCPGMLPEPVSIEERIQMFNDDLNNPGVNMQKHFHPTETASYAQIADPDFWAASPLASVNDPVITIVSVDGTTVTAGFSNYIPVAWTIVLEMTTYGSDYVIRTLDLNDGAFKILRLP